jgi:hypothetical protein
VVCPLSQILHAMCVSPILMLGSLSEILMLCPLFIALDTDVVSVPDSDGVSFESYTYCVSVE